MVTWLILGLIGWAALVAYRVYDESWPKNEPMISYIKGFVGCLVCGPICFAFLIHLLYGRYKDGKVTRK